MGLTVEQNPPARSPIVHFGGRVIPVVLPSLADPRLRLAVVIVSLQVLGQVGLGFKVSIAQILISVGVCALVEMIVSYRQQHALVWPASAMLTGNSIAFILRTPGTGHGNWWSLNGIEWFILASVVGILSSTSSGWATATSSIHPTSGSCSAF